jgi:hypothetical protein
MAIFEPKDKDVENSGHLPVTLASEIDEDSLHKTDILSLEHTDPVLNAKMHLVNNAIDEIGFTGYQWKLFVLNGFG